MEDDFALHYVRIYPGANSLAELVTLAPGLRSERRFAPLARGQYIVFLGVQRFANINAFEIKSFIKLEIHACSNRRLTNQKCNYILGPWSIFTLLS